MLIGFWKVLLKRFYKFRFLIDIFFILLGCFNTLSAISFLPYSSTPLRMAKKDVASIVNAILKWTIMQNKKPLPIGSFPEWVIKGIIKGQKEGKQKLLSQLRK